jgi:hypothetical protein
MERGSYPSVGVGVAWIACNLIGWFAAAALALALRVIGSPFDGPGAFVVAIVPPALAQWLVLRRLFGLTPLWLITIPLGCLLFVGLSAAIPAAVWEIVDDESLVTLSTMYALLGGLVGLGQWVILRRRFSGAGVWILASAAGTGLGLAIVLATNLIDASGFAAYTVVVLTYALLSGAALALVQTRAAPRQAVLAG